MSQRQSKNDQAFILHTSNYQETSLICRALTKHFGYLSFISKGARRAKQNKKALLQPFQLLNIEFVGKSDLKTLTSVEPSQELSVQLSPMTFAEPNIYACSSYLNELLMRALEEGEVLDNLFESYLTALQSLVGGKQQALALRQFEWQLLSGLGLAPEFEADADSNPIVADSNYMVRPEKRPVPVSAHEIGAIDGRTLIAIVEGQLEQASARHLRRLLQTLLQPVIGDRPLQSRKLWQHYH